MMREKMQKDLDIYELPEDNLMKFSGEKFEQIWNSKQYDT